MSCTGECDNRDFAAPRAWRRWLIGVLALAGAALSGYLAFVSLAASGRPAGCGQDSPCAEAFSSRWSNIAGAPVSALALAAYLAAIVAVVFLCPRRMAVVRQAAWAALLSIGGAVAAAAVWFIGLQATVLGGFCPWCMAAHAIAIGLAAIVWWSAPWPWTRSPSPADRDAPATPRRFTWISAAGFAGLGISLALSMIAAQFVIGPASPPLRRLAAGQDDDTGPGAERRLSVLGGRLIIDPNDEPMLGDANTARLMIVLFDYCCPHCRATHGYLQQGLKQRSGQWGAVMLPMPMSAECNPAVRFTEPRFQNACGLARLALAVWRADRAKFPEFDSWLFEPETPRSLEDAQTKAEELVGRERLRAALESPDIEARIARNVKAYADSKAEYIPILMAPGADAIVGKPESVQELFEALEAKRPEPVGKPAE